ncbi:MAG: polyprenol monophosphomannose synthase [Candidatus Aenigmarchaeota archaeon]|nr:polyprenol monophosphomannose synthase [Candidatus Aenigmarchaeota archaeon]
MMSIVIPTYNEKDNIEKLVKDIRRRMEAEIIIVDDDSPDGTGELADRLAKRYKNIRVLHRTEKKGLGSAIIEGFKMSSGNVIGVMDADFSHPPALIKKMSEEFENGADIVLGSRYTKGGRIENWPLRRKIASRFAVLLARPLTTAKDPVTGFFFVRKKIFDKIKIKSGETKSWKVSLEIIARGDYKKLVEVPYTFVNRRAGKSKISVKEYKNYLGQVFSLMAFKLKKKLKRK